MVSADQVVQDGRERVKDAEDFASRRGEVEAEIRRNFAPQIGSAGTLRRLSGSGGCSTERSGEREILSLHDGSCILKRMGWQDRTASRAREELSQWPSMCWRMPCSSSQR